MRPTPARSTTAPTRRTIPTRAMPTQHQQQFCALSTSMTNSGTSAGTNRLQPAAVTKLIPLLNDVGVESTSRSASCSSPGSLTCRGEPSRAMHLQKAKRRPSTIGPGSAKALNPHHFLDRAQIGTTTALIHAIPVPATGLHLAEVLEVPCAHHTRRGQQGSTLTDSSVSCVATTSGSLRPVILRRWPPTLPRPRSPPLQGKQSGPYTRPNSERTRQTARQTAKRSSISRGVEVRPDHYLLGHLRSKHKQPMFGGVDSKIARDLHVKNVCVLFLFAATV